MTIAEAATQIRQWSPSHATVWVSQRMHRGVMLYYAAVFIPSSHKTGWEILADEIDNNLEALVKEIRRQLSQ